MSPFILYSFIVMGFSKVIPMVVGIINWKYHDDRVTKMVIYFILSMILELTAFILIFTRGTNLFMTHAGKFTEVIILSTVLIVPLNFQRNKLPYIGAVLLVLSGMMFEVYIQQKALQTLDFFNSPSAGAGALLITILSILALFDVRKNNPEPILTKVPIFIISWATLLYFSSGILIYSFTQTLLVKDPNTLTNIQYFHQVIYLVMNLICTYAFVQSRRNHQSQQKQIK